MKKKLYLLYFVDVSNLHIYSVERPCSTAVVHQIVALVTLVRLLARALFLLYIHRRRNLYVSYIEKKYSIKPKQSIKNIIQTVLSFVFTFCLSLQTLCFYHSFQSSFLIRSNNLMICPCWEIFSTLLYFICGVEDTYTTALIDCIIRHYIVNNILMYVSSFSSAGRAWDWRSWGRWFKPGREHF